jgi:hypothetical protein
MELKFCQSCGMPLTEELLGTNANGSKNEEYCIYCYKDGAFTGDFTMEEMVEFCSQYVDEYNKNTGESLNSEEYKNVLRQFYPSLKRWQLPADQLPHATSPIKQKLIEEINALGINGLPEINNLFVLQGSYVNMEYEINGNKVKLLYGVRTAETENGPRQYQAVASRADLIMPNNAGAKSIERLEKNLANIKANGSYPSTEFKVQDLEEWTVEPTNLEKKTDDDPFGAELPWT